MMEGRAQKRDEGDGCRADAHSVCGLGAGEERKTDDPKVTPRFACTGGAIRRGVEWRGEV
jgi:hypothetical protein